MFISSLQRNNEMLADSALVNSVAMARIFFPMTATDVVETPPSFPVCIKAPIGNNTIRTLKIML
jgi:hypothetical protein